MNKTLIGKDDYLFLNNDTSKELEVHCNNLNLVCDKTLSKYTFKNYLLIIYPDKSIYYKQYLPDNFIAKYRPATEIYLDKLQNKVLDTYDFLQHESDIFYKTDTHINLKGNYVVYLNFIEKINNLFNLNINPIKLDILSKNCVLNTLPTAIGDLTWVSNLGNQKLNNINDTYYYTNDIIDFYNVYNIKDNDIRFLDYNLIDKTLELDNKHEHVHWGIISNYIIYKKNNNENFPKIKVLIFYDSFLLNIIPLYFEMFYEIYLIKTPYNNDFINKINPDYVFEFRVERFLF
jgi:hypothetical protein